MTARMNRIGFTLGVCAIFAGFGHAATTNIAYVCNGDKVFRFDADTGEYKGFFGQGFVTFATGACLAPNGDILISDYTGGKIVRFDPDDGTYKGSFGTGFLGRPIGGSIGPDGLFYVGSDTQNMVFRFDPVDGTYHGTLGAGFIGAYGNLCFGGDGTLYVDDNSGKIIRFETDGTYKGTFGSGFLNTNYGSVIGPDGIMYVNNLAGGGNNFGYVAKFVPETGEYKGIISDGFSRNPYGLAMDASGNLGIAAAGFGWVTRMEGDGTYQGYYGFGFMSANASFLGTTTGFDCTVEYQDYLKGEDTYDVEVEIRPVGSTTPTYAFTTTPDSSGNFSVTAGVSGPVDIAVKAKHWLRKTMTVFVTSGKPANCNFSLTNGDIDNDNQITLLDYDLFSAAYDTVLGGGGFNPDADLDGDDAVTLLDFDIWSAHFDEVGDA